MPQLDPSFVGKVSYAPFTAPGISFAVSDGGGPKQRKPDDGNITLSLRVPSPERLSRYSQRWPTPAPVMTPYGDVPWGGKFGHLRDRFENEWFVLS